MPRPLLAIACLAALLSACGSEQGAEGAPQGGEGEALGTDVSEAPVADTALEEVSEDTAPEVDPGESLRVNHIQCKGTHNSTHIEPEFAVPEWRYTHRPLYEQLDLHGVRQLELDVHYDGEGGFDVFHLPRIDEETVCRRLFDCLSEIKRWSDEHPGHHLLFILVEPKDELDFQTPIAGHYQELNEALLAVWPPERVLLPDDVRGGYSSLREALEAEGWPTLAATRQMAMFIMLDSDAHRTAYLAEHPGLEGAVLFARGGVGEPWGSVVEGGSAEAKLSAAMAGYLVRGSADSPEDSDEANHAKAAAAMASPAHFISSDAPYARDEGYWFDLLGGAPSRCNPVTAPPECRAEDIEALPLDQ